MNQALQLGFKGFQNLPSFAATPSHLKIGTLVFFRVRAMGSKRLLSNSSTPVSEGIDDKKDKKLKGLVGASPNSEKAVVKKCDDVVGIQSIMDDQARVEAMTVQELRTTLRSVGIPAKGGKRDLVSALKCFMDKKMEGEGSQEAGEQISSICIESISLKKKVNSLSDEISIQDISTVMEVSLPEQGQRRVRCRQQISNGEAIEVSVKNVTQTKKLSINTDGVSGNKPSSAKRKISSERGTEDAVANDGFNLAMKQAEPWTIFAHKKPQKGWTVYNPRIMRPPPLSGDTKFVKLMSWNVNGLRALLKLEGFSALQLAHREDFDVLCLQETKLQEKDVQAIKQCLIDGYENSFWTCSISKLGYSGTAIISRIKPLSVRYGLGISDHDSEGRLVTAEFDSFYLISGYVPNSGDGLRRLSYRVTEWDSSLSNYLKELEKSKPVILAGDLNCAHEEIDIYNPSGNKRSAGFTDEERESFKTNFLSRGFVDTFRMQHRNVIGYTYWGYRHGARKTNRGWRLDYFLVSESIADKVHDSYILPDVTGSDHCPIGLVLKH